MDRSVSSYLLGVVLMMSLHQSTDGCSLTHWEHWPMKKILTYAEIVVYGRETTRLTSSKNADTQDAIFKVYCILKDHLNTAENANITQDIRIVGVQPVDSCSGTDVPPNKDVILALRRDTRDEESVFVWHEPNPVPDGAVFLPSADNLRIIEKMTCLKNFRAPPGRDTAAEPSCPTQKSSHTYDVDSCNAATRSVNAANAMIGVLVMMSLGKW